MSAEENSYAIEPELRLCQLKDKINELLAADQAAAAMEFLPTLLAGRRYKDIETLQRFNSVILDQGRAEQRRDLWLAAALSAWEDKELDRLLSCLQQLHWIEHKFSSSSPIATTACGPLLRSCAAEILGSEWATAPTEPDSDSLSSDSIPSDSIPSDSIRIGVILESFAPDQRPLQLAEAICGWGQTAAPHWSIYVYSSLAMQREGLAVYEAEKQLQRLKDLGAKVFYKLELLPPTAQTKLLAQQIQSDQLQVLFVSALDLLPLWSLIVERKVVPLQIIDECSVSYPTPQPLLALIQKDRAAYSVHQLFFTDSDTTAAGVAALKQEIISRLRPDCLKPPAEQQISPPEGATDRESFHSMAADDDTTVLAETGLLLLQQDRAADALALLERLLTLRPDMYALKYAQALALSRLDRKPEALGTLKELLAQQPGHLRAKELLRELQPDSPESTPAPESEEISMIAEAVPIPNVTVPNVETTPLEITPVEQPVAAEVAPADSSTTAPAPDHRATAQVEQLLNQAIRALQNNNFEQAYQDLQQAEALGVAVPDLYYFEALYWLSTNEFAKALKAVKKELEFFPEQDAAQALFEEMTAKVIEGL